MRCGERLEQVDRLARDDRRDPLGDLAVVHGVGDIVALGRRGGAHVQRRIDDEVLPDSALVLVARRAGRTRGGRSA